MQPIATVVVTGPMIAADAQALLRDHSIDCVPMEPAAVERDLATVVAGRRPQGLIVRYGTVDARVMDAAPQLQVIANHGAGYDNIDVAAATARGLPVLVARAANAVSVAEMAVSLMLALLKQLRPFDDAVKAGRWRPAGVVPVELAGRRVGLVGMGATGRATAALLRAFRADLAAYDPQVTAGPAEPLARPFDRLDDLLAWADIVTLHLPLTDATRGLFNRARLRAMKQGAILVNCARGQIVDEAALAEALQDGHLAGAAVDTFAVEPCGTGLALLRAPNLIATPHVAGVTQEAFRRMGMMAAQNILSILRRTALARENLVNPAVLDHPKLKAAPR